MSRLDLPSDSARDNAAFICQLVASNPDVDRIFEMYRIDHETIELIEAAFFGSPDLSKPCPLCGHEDDQRVLEWACAEAMLRTGWSP